MSLREKKTNVELRESMGIEKISDVMRHNRLRWMGHVLRKEGNDWVKKSMDMTVEGSREVLQTGCVILYNAQTNWYIQDSRDKYDKLQFYTVNSTALQRCAHCVL